MQLPRRFIFRGQASGVAAHILRPVDRQLPVQAASSLPVIGGLSESKVGPGRLQRYVSFLSAATSAAGNFQDAKQAVAITNGELAPDAAPTETTVTARVRRIEVLQRLSIGLAEARIVARSPEPGAQPSIHPNGNKIERVKVDASRLKITLAESLYCEHGTKQQLAEAYAKGLPERHARLFFGTGAKARSTRLPESNGLVYCTLVESMEWVGKPHPTATIDGHVLTIPDFGKVYFGEMFISDFSRRLTLVRIDLGSPAGGFMAMAEVETNGSFWP